MTRTTNVESASSLRTLSFKFAPTSEAAQETATALDPLLVICVDVDLSSREVPDGFVGLRELRTKRAQNPRRQAAVERARQRLAGYVSGGSETLKSFRLSHGLSQQEFAERLGTTQPYVSRIEKSPSNAGVDFMRRLCQVFGIDMNRADELLK